MKILANIRFIIPAFIILIVSIPLILDKIPPNGLYGFRTPKTLSDPKIWYAANHFLGYAMLISSIISVIGLIAISLNSELIPQQNSFVISLCIFLIPLLLSFVVSMIYLSKL